VRVRTAHLDVRVLAGAEATAPRVGIVVPRHKHTAVDRNRLKRRLRELVRTRLLPTLPPCHVVFRARSEAYDDDFDALARQVERAGREIAQRAHAGVPANAGAVVNPAPPDVA